MKKALADATLGTVELVELDADEAAAIAATGAEISAELTAAAAADVNAETLRDRALQAIETLEAAHAGWANLSAANKDAALRLTVRVVIALARLTLRRLDKA